MASKKARASALPALSPPPVKARLGPVATMVAPPTWRQAGDFFPNNGNQRSVSVSAVTVFAKSLAVDGRAPSLNLDARAQDERTGEANPA